jgi:hypothetical protein
MSPQRPGGLAFRAVGGDVVSRAGPLAGSGLHLPTQLGREAMRCDNAGDVAAARGCAHMAGDLAATPAKADDWRRAAHGQAAPMFFSSVEQRDLARRANPVRNG